MICALLHSFISYESSGIDMSSITCFALHHFDYLEWFCIGVQQITKLTVGSDHGYESQIGYIFGSAQKKGGNLNNLLKV